LTDDVVLGYPPPGRTTAHTPYNHNQHPTAYRAWATITRATERAPIGPQAICRTPGFGQPNGAGASQTTTRTEERLDSHKNPNVPTACRQSQRVGCLCLDAEANRLTPRRGDPHVTLQASRRTTKPQPKRRRKAKPTPSSTSPKRCQHGNPCTRFQRHVSPHRLDR
jgi:hypothetical protein